MKLNIASQANKDADQTVQAGLSLCLHEARPMYKYSCLDFKSKEGLFIMANRDNVVCIQHTQLDSCRGYSNGPKA